MSPALRSQASSLGVEIRGDTGAPAVSSTFRPKSPEAPRSPSPVTLFLILLRRLQQLISDASVLTASTGSGGKLAPSSGAGGPSPSDTHGSIRLSSSSSSCLSTPSTRRPPIRSTRPCLSATHCLPIRPTSPYTRAMTRTCRRTTARAGRTSPLSASTSSCCPSRASSSCSG